MVIRPIINVRSDKLSHGFTEAVKLCRELSSDKTGVILDLAEVHFVSPSFLLPVIVYMHQLGFPINMINIGTYLSTVSFSDGGIDAASFARSSAFKSYMESYSSKSYIPIIKFPTDLDGSDKRNTILQCIDNILSRQVPFANNVILALKYVIGEVVDNIIEHACSEFGYIMAQSYPNQGYTDICIADTGHTIIGSYAENPRTAEISSDIEAIQAAVNGISAKNLPNAENRGYGFRTSINMLTKGLGGEYLLASGNSAYARNRRIDQYLTLPYGLRFEGTIVAFRIPHTENEFNYINYVE
jgi:anti-sigma regulatory factor (Ser/Thr protein kinase)|uniref:hypothetical protein n=1 Tax=Candidatus Cryptobacteroides bacterium TaxID=3085639 RepID=UPI00402624F7